MKQVDHKDYRAVISVMSNREDGQYITMIGRLSSVTGDMDIPEELAIEFVDSSEAKSLALAESAFVKWAEAQPPIRLTDILRP